MGPALASQSVEAIAVRLGNSTDVRLPYSALKSNGDPVDSSRRQAYLQALLSRDPGVFLERHGALLLQHERDMFKPLAGDYEVDFHLQLLSQGAEPINQRHRRAVVNNRRLARLRQLEQTDFFGDSAMRHRAPLLHYKLLGQYEGLADAAPGFAPGALLSESLMRYNDEVLYRQRLQQETEDEEQQEADEEEEEEEEEEDDSEGHEEEDNEPARDRVEDEGNNDVREAAGTCSDCDAGADQFYPESARGGAPRASISAAQLESNREEFTRLMKEKYLSGADTDVDYAAVDNDATLDDYWRKDREWEIQEKYFEEE